MCKFYLKFALIGTGLLLVGCERSSLSPVEIKIDDDSGYTSVDAAVSGSTLMTTHVVKNNETLFDIAYQYNIDPMNLAKVNGIKAPYNIRNGQVLKLPTADMPTGESGTLSYGEPEAKKEDSSKLDSEFAEVMATTGGVTGSVASGAASTVGSAAKGTASVGTSFNEQAAELSVPKVTKTATGATAAAAEKPDGALVSANTNNKLSKFIKPVDGKVISKFGSMQDGVKNDGINIKAALGSEVKAAANGKVIYAGNKLEEEYGNVIIVQHDNDLITSYAHLDKINKKNGALVRTGEVIGTVGKTGDVETPQLHFEVLKDKNPENPEKYITNM
ncbi:MAG: M23 family metallopeptidase [Alphaproteobacteria bacterium]|nr:M23 family metallopeptidase [Alphaproteobacteria bacterium]